MNATITQQTSTGEAHGPATACLNCGTALSSRFCPDCGQPAATHRFTVGHLLHEIPHSVWHVDRGLPYTVREMLLRPGPTVRRYLAGKRVDYFRPFALVLLLAGLVAFLMLSLHVQMLEPPTTGPVSPTMAQALALNQLVFKYFAWFTVGMLPGFALCSWLLLRRLRYNYAEHLIANALMLGAIVFIQLLFVPLMAWTSGSPAFRVVFLAENVMMPLFHTWAFAQLALGTYTLGGALWRGAAVAVFGLLLNTLLINNLALFIISLRH